MNNMYRNIPKVDLIIEALCDESLDVFSHREKSDAARDVLDEIRGEIKNLDLNNQDDIVDIEKKLSLEFIVGMAKNRLTKSMEKSLKKVINATGVVLHTNLGRANLSKRAIEAVEKIAGEYSTLEYDESIGERGSRHAHTEELITKITGAEASIVVNNNAAATMIVLAAMARGGEVIVSRGELVEIGGSFRIPDIMKESGAVLKEIGTTNKTKPGDYEDAINENTKAILKVHTSNYKVVGFTQEASLPELKEIAVENDLPLIYDMGSGLLRDLRKYGIGEPCVEDAINEGADLVLFSGDKLLGGAQAGIIIGKKEYVDRLKKHPLARALRVDKMTIAAICETFRAYLNEDTVNDEIPVLKMLTSDIDDLFERARKLEDLIISKSQIINTDIIKTKNKVGGGSAPDTELDGYAVVINIEDMTPDDIEMALRAGEIPIVARITNNQLLLDVRTIRDEDIDYIANRIKEIAMS
ncbi:MAG: L-seryl-tRNA(Sec) selenium transferase [Eubacteriales bacterium]|nr:L-seryl-tRNA(Sec) selenium transferase [Eubacteriales bacterium]MDY3332300.1 L-seryl-tRNA(Sec) selenium transferase [Gallibacter sp.]